MRILIIEDETPNFLKLQKMINSMPIDAEIVGPVDTVAESREKLGEGGFDLIIADIRLSDGLIFDAFEGVTGETPVIFTTAYDEYAIRAFKYNGIDYLLKPIDATELAAAIERASHASASRSTLSELYRMLAGERRQYRKRFLVADRDGFLAVSADDASYLFSEGGVTQLFLKDHRHFILDSSLEELEGQLDPADFLRVTRQHIVRIDSVGRLVNWFNRKMKVVLTEYPDEEIVVGKDKTSRLKQWLGY